MVASGPQPPRNQGIRNHRSRAGWRRGRVDPRPPTGLMVSMSHGLGDPRSNRAKRRQVLQNIGRGKHPHPSRTAWGGRATPESLQGTFRKADSQPRLWAPPAEGCTAPGSAPRSALRGVDTPRLPADDTVKTQQRVPRPPSSLKNVSVYQRLCLPWRLRTNILLLSPLRVCRPRGSRGPRSSSGRV